MVVEDAATRTSLREGMHVLFGDREDRFASYLRTGVEYAQRPTRPLHLSILTPVRAEEGNRRGLTYPLVVFVQGSGFNKQDLSANIPQIAEVAHHGFVVASVEYRPASEAPFPGQIDDVRLAVKYLVANASSLGADPTRIGLWGGSSGAYTVVMLAVTAHGPDLGGDIIGFELPDIKAVVDFYGPTDFLALEGDPRQSAREPFATGRANLLGGAAHDRHETAVRANPLTHITPVQNLPPFLIVHGDEDETVPIEQSLLLHDALARAGTNVTFLKVRGGGHGTNIFTREVLAYTVGFLRSYL